MRTDTLQQLRELPELAVEVELTRDAPNPGEQAATSSRTPPSSRPPLNLAMLHALLPDGGRDYVGLGLRGQLGMCVRMIVEEMADQDLTMDIPVYPSDTWSGVTDWLVATHPWWSEQQWADDVEAEVRSVHSTLRNLAREQRAPIYHCPKCHGALLLQPGATWLRCNDCEHQESADLEARYRRRPPSPASVICEEFGVTRDRLRLWRHRRRLKVARTAMGEPWYYPWDVLLLANPVIAEAIEKRESLSACRERRSS